MSATSRAAATQRLTVSGSASAFPTFSGDFRQRFANALPNAVEVVSPVPVGGGTIRVDFDPRLLALSDGAAQLVADDGVTSTLMSVDGGSVTVPIPEHVRASRVVVALPFFSTVSYPTENTGASTAPKAHVTLQGQVADGNFPLDLPSAQGLAWGGEIDVAWRRQATGGDADYFVPALLSLTSVGPGPVPAGTRIQVRTDSVLTEEVRPLPAPAIDPEPGVTGSVPVPDPSAAAPTLTVTTAQGDGVRSTVILLEDALAPGTTFTTALSRGENAAHVRVKAVTFAQVSVEPPEDSRAMQRVTGAETVTSLAPGGLPLAADMLMGSI